MYEIEIKTPEGTYIEKEELENLALLLEKYPGYEEVKAKQIEKEDQ